MPNAQIATRSVNFGPEEMHGPSYISSHIEGEQQWDTGIGCRQTIH